MTLSAHDPLAFAGIVLAMAAAVYLTRVSGFWLIGRFAIGPRLRRMLDTLPGAIIAATVAPLLVHGGLAGLAAVAGALAAMLALRNDFAAVLAGMAAAALVRFAGF
ncbi:MAG: AzlD family protein [Xanthobacteraceae bacterium]|uniref:AzlD family protein n=1 Tax=Pseudolabrys sp. TaxID=1960880 RepID=UPI003D0AD020